MKFKRIQTIIISMVVFMFISGNLHAKEWPRTGIGFRGNYWNFVDNGHEIRVYNHFDFTEVNAGGFGGSLFFISQIRKQVFLEFTIGAIGNVHNRVRYWDGEHVDAVVLIPVLFGVHYNFLPDEIETTLQPYASFGIGAYWLNDIEIEEDYHYNEEAVYVDTSGRPGAYAGVGLNFLLTKNFAINYDMRFHLVDFQTDNYNSGFEFGIGFVVMWGGNGK